MTYIKQNPPRVRGSWSKKYNVFDLSNEYGIGYTTNTNIPFYFDKDDYDKIKTYAWREDINSGYIVSSSRTSIIYIHRIIMNCCERKQEVDHINHNKADNRKQNLRICTHQQNNCNKPKTKLNTSGHVGVMWEKRFNKWRARIFNNGKDIHLGLFDNFEDAVAAREMAEIKYHKEFRYKGEK